jgi:hypothetical protein
VIVREKSIVQSRLNYRVICETPDKIIDFFIYYIYKVDLVKIIDVNVTVTHTKTNIEEAVENSQNEEISPKGES